MRHIVMERIYHGITESGVLDDMVRWKDDFSFFHDDFIYTEYQHDLDLCDMGIIDEEDFEVKYPEEIDPSEVSKYYVTDRCAPEYVRRFEDNIPAKNMERFIRHVLNNVMRNNNGYKHWKKEHQVGTTFTDADDGEETNECELQVEESGDLISDSRMMEAKKELAYCLYRMNRLSRRCGVNILSLVFAYRRVRGGLRSRIPNKPSAILAEGPVYYSNQSGDCTTPITDATDRAFTKARDILLVNGGETWTEFAEDYRKLDQCLSILAIDVRSEDPRRYTSEFIKRISRKIMVDNYSYVARVNGGYNKDILKGLRTLSLDMVQNSSIEKVVDPVALALNLILDTPTTPASIYRAFNKTPPDESDDLCYSVLPMLAKSKLMPVLSSAIGYGKLTADGFLCDVDEQYFIVNGLIAVPKEWSYTTTGRIYFHVSGYAFFEPIGNVLLLATIGDLVHCLDLEDWDNLRIVAVGPGADDLP